MFVQVHCECDSCGDDCDNYDGDGDDCDSDDGDGEDCSADGSDSEELPCRGYGFVNEAFTCMSLRKFVITQVIKKIDRTRVSSF